MIGWRKGHGGARRLEIIVWDALDSSHLFIVVRAGRSMKKPCRGRVLRGVKDSGNHKLAAVFAVDPFGGFATASPGLAGSGVAVFGSDFAGGFGCAGFGTTGREDVLGGQAIFGHEFACFGNGAGDFVLAGLGNGLLQGFALGVALGRGECRLCEARHDLKPPPGRKPVGR